MQLCCEITLVIQIVYDFRPKCSPLSSIIIACILIEVPPSRMAYSRPAYRWLLLLASSSSCLLASFSIKSVETVGNPVTIPLWCNLPLRWHLLSWAQLQQPPTKINGSTQTSRRNLVFCRPSRGSLVPSLYLHVIISCNCCGRRTFVLSA